MGDKIPFAPIHEQDICIYKSFLAFFQKIPAAKNFLGEMLWGDEGSGK